MRYLFCLVSAAIKELSPQTVVLKNQIPRDHAKFPFYRNLIRGEGEEEIISQKPRLGAFEISYKGQLIFSKIKLGYWPHFTMVAQKVKKILDSEA